MRIIHFEMEMVAIGTRHVNINLVFDWLIVLVQVIKFHNCVDWHTLANLRSNTRKNETVSKRMKHFANFRSNLRKTEKKSHILGHTASIFKLSAGLKLAISAYALVFKSKGCLRLALKCCSGQRLLYLFCKSKQS